ncbi:hypothetical protein [Rhizobium sp. ZPR3]|uniref:Uncharacterized protein n=2 Tax=unclassified Rhizobium TaxID=2613769 RepID=A0AAU7SRF4_9HYPH
MLKTKTTPRNSNQHQRKRVQSPSDNGADSRVFLFKEHYERVIRIAADHEQRFPILLGLLIADYFEIVDSQMEVHELHQWWAQAPGEDLVEPAVFIPKMQFRKIAHGARLGGAHPHPAWEASG